MSTFIRVGAPHGEFKEFTDKELPKNINKLPLVNMIRGLGISVDTASEYMNDFLTKTCGYKSDDLKKNAIKRYNSSSTPMTYADLCIADIESSAVGRICFIGHCVHSIKPPGRVFSDQVNMAARDALRDEELADAAGESYTPSYQQHGHLLVHHPLVVKFHRMMKKIKENENLFEFDALHCIYLEMYRQTKTLSVDPFVYMDPQIDGYIEVRKILDIDFYPKIATDSARDTFLKRIALVETYKATIEDVNSKIKPKKAGGGLLWVDIHRMSMFLNVGKSIIEHLSLDWPNRTETDIRCANVYTMMLGIVYVSDKGIKFLPSTNTGYLCDKVDVDNDTERTQLTEDVKRLVKDCTKSKFDEYLKITDSEFETFKGATIRGEPILRGTKRPNEASGSSKPQPVDPPPQPPVAPPPTATVPPAELVAASKYKRLLSPGAIRNLERLFEYVEKDPKPTYETCLGILRDIEVVGKKTYDKLKDKSLPQEDFETTIEATDSFAAVRHNKLNLTISLGLKGMKSVGYDLGECDILLTNDDKIETFIDQIRMMLDLLKRKRAKFIAS